MPEIKVVPPSRHAPNWRYMCPHCGTHWEMEEKCADFRQVCKDCVLILLKGQDQTKFNTPVWYGDRVIPQGFKEVLDHIDGLEKNWDTLRQIEDFLEDLKLLVAKKEVERIAARNKRLEELDASN